MDTSDLSTVRARSRDWLALAVLILPCVLYAMDFTVLNLVVPALTSAIHPTGTELLWILDIYGFVVAAMLITMGALGDRYGRRRVLLIGAAAFAIASVGAAYARCAGELIFARALLGLAGATVAPGTLSLIRCIFKHKQDRGVAVAVWVASYSVGAALGPVVGGVLLKWFWWGSVFLVALPFMGLLLIVGPLVLPEYKNPKSAPIDVSSATLSLVAVLAVVRGLKSVAAGGPLFPAVGLVLGGLILSGLFVRRQFRIEAPLVPFTLLRDRQFLTAFLTYALVSFVSFGSFIFVPQYLQLVLGLSTLHAGLSSIPLALALMLSSGISPALARYVARKHLIIAGLLIASAAYVVLSVLNDDTGGIAVVVTCCIYSIGLGGLFVITTDLIVSSVPAEQAGSASAFAETGSELGASLGVALLGSIGLAVYRAMLAATPAAWDMSGTETLGAAVQHAHQLGGVAGDTLLRAARAAFLDGWRVAAAVSAGALALTAGWVARRMEATKHPVDKEALPS